MGARNGVELLRPEGSPDESDVARMRELGVEMIVVMAYGRMLKKTFWSTANIRA